MTYQTLRLPEGSLISGTVRVPCQGCWPHACSEYLIYKIEDIDVEGHGDELHGIDETAENLEFRCDECRAMWRQKCYEEDYDQD